MPPAAAALCDVAAAQGVPLKLLCRLWQAGLALLAIYAVYTVPSLLPRWGASWLGLLLLAGWAGCMAIAWPIARGLLPARAVWAGIAMAGLLLRLAALLLFFGRAPGTGDPKEYLEFAQELLAGSGLHFADSSTGVTFLALYPPAYPLLLALLGAVAGLSQAALLASNFALELASAVLIGRIGAQLGEAAAGRAAAWLFMTWPTFALAAPFAQKEPLVLLLVLAIVALLLGQRARPVAWRDGAALGGLTGLLALTQPGLALFPAVLGIAFLGPLGVRRLWSLGWRAAPAALLVMAPWWIRNALLLHAFVPLTTTGGLSLWIGNNSAATGNWMPLPAHFAGLPEVQMSAQAAAEAKAWIVEHPLEFVRLTLTKVFRAMGVEQFTAVRIALLQPAPPPAVNAAVFPLCHGAWTAMLAAAGLLSGAAMRRPAGRFALILALACLAEVALFGVWFEFSERHRYFLLPFLVLTVASGMAALRAPRRSVETPPFRPSMRAEGLSR